MQYRISVRNASQTLTSWNYFGRNLFNGCPVVSKFHTKHGSDTAVLCAQFEQQKRVLRTNDISRGLGFRWVSGRYPLLQSDKTDHSSDIRFKMKPWKSVLPTIAHFNSLGRGRFEWNLDKQFASQFSYWYDCFVKGTNLSEIWSEIHTFSLKKMYLTMSSGKWRPFCLGLNVLMVCRCIDAKPSPEPITNGHSGIN